MKHSRRLTGLLTTLACFLVLQGSALGEEQVDTIFKRRPDGSIRPLKTYITSETFKGLQVQLGKKGGPISKIEAYVVARIVHFDEPSSYSAAVDAMAQGRYAEAAKQFEKALTAPGVRQFWLKQSCIFYIAECYRMMARTDSSMNNKAIAKYKELSKVKPDSRFIPDAKVGMARAFMQAGDFKSAKKTLKSLAAKSFDYGQIWSQRADLELARLQEEQGEYDAAISSYTRLAERVKDQQLRGTALSGQGRCLIKKKDYDGALAFYTQLLKREDADDALKARAHNGAGKSFLAKAADTRDAKKKKDLYTSARWEFLRTMVFYPALAEENATAMYNAAECFVQLGQKHRAKQLLKELREIYPDSPEAAKSSN